MPGNSHRERIRVVVDSGKLVFLVGRVGWFGWVGWSLGGLVGLHWVWCLVGCFVLFGWWTCSLELERFGCCLQWLQIRGEVQSLILPPSSAVLRGKRMKNGVSER